MITKTINDKNVEFEATSNNFKFSSAVAGFGLLHRDSDYKGNASYSMIKNLGLKAKGDDLNGYRNEFINLVETADLLSEKL